jgi:hypothetical protein
MCQTYFDLHCRKFRCRRRAISYVAATSVVLFCSMLLGCAGGTSTSSIQPITPGAPSAPGSVFFGMHVNRAVPGQFPYPTIPFGSYRTLDSGVLWSDIETSSGQYSFNKLQNRLADAQVAGVDVVYTIYNTPPFHSSNPTDANCGTYTSTGLEGGCDPPVDVNADGSGTDASLIAFLQKLVGTVGNQIKYYEIWNEVNVTTEWTGTNQQLVRMAQDTRNTILAANPNAQFLSPSFANLAYAGSGAAGKMADYLYHSPLADGTTGSSIADIINFHGYVFNADGSPPQAETEVTNVNNLRALLSSTDLAKPLWDTEFSYGPNGLGDPDLNAAFIASHLLIQGGQSIARTYYFDWDITEQEALWSNTNSPTGPCLGAGTPNNVGFLCETGIAYQQVESWLTGNTVTTPCSGPLPPNRGVWTCGITKAGGTQELAVWDSSQSCSGGNCTTSSYTYSGPFTSFLTLTGGNTSAALGGSTVQVGVKPILLSQ